MPRPWLSLKGLKMWEKIKDWILSDNFPWFMLGWTFCEAVNFPDALNIVLVAFWIWVLTREW